MDPESPHGLRRAKIPRNSLRFQNPLDSRASDFVEKQAVFVDATGEIRRKS
jgi:hypothetical protein